MSANLTSQLRSRPRRDRAASQVPSGGPAASAGPLRRFPFAIAALIVVVAATFVLFVGAMRDGSEPAPLANPWSHQVDASERVPATPSRGAMGGSPQPVAARIAP